MAIIFETERFFARHIERTDRNNMFKLDADPEVHTYLGNNPVKDISETDAIIQSIQDQYKRLGVGRLAIIDKTSHEFLGWTGLKKLEQAYNNQIHVYDLGYRLIKDYWGKGVATEMAVGSLHYGFNRLQLPKITAMAHCDNAGSNHVLTKIGMQFTGTFTLDNTLHSWYEISHADYLEQYGNRSIL